MIWDCITFFNELEMLEIRFNELNNYVDKFVICESKFTHSGNIKALVYDNHKHRFSAFADKIVHVVVEDMPNTTNPWDNEWHQRQCIWRGLSGAAPGDIVMISDADEIPRGSEIHKAVGQGYCGFEQQMSYLFVNGLCGKWSGTKAFEFSGDTTLDLTNSIRYNKDDKNMHLIDNGGWHFTYLGGAGRVREKIQSFAHQELNNATIKNKTRLQRCINQGVDPVHGGKLTYKPLDKTYPEYLINNQNKFQALIKKI